MDRDVAAIPVFKRKGGLLLAVPDGVFTADEIAAGAVGAEIPDLGPTTTLQVAVQGDVVDQTTSVLMFDAPWGPTQDGQRAPFISEKAAN